MDRGFHRFLNQGFMHVVAALKLCARIEISAGCRENELPSPVTIGIDVFHRQGVWEPNTTRAIREVFLMQQTDSRR